MKLDFKESPQGYEIACDVPGVKKQVSFILVTVKKNAYVIVCSMNP